MIELLKDQPPSARKQVLDLLRREAVQMAVMLHLDFASKPLFLSNMRVPFVDLRWGYKWGAGAGLLVGLPEIRGGDGQLAPFREYQLGLLNEWIDRKNWAADLVKMVGAVEDYRGRNIGLYGQLFDPDSNQPVGHPFAFDVGFMDRMTVSFQGGGAVVSLTSESFMARKGAPVYGMLTHLDQQRRFPEDQGLQFTTEKGKPITLTDW